MTRIDWVILRRLASRVLLTLLVLFGMVALVEASNTWRFQHLSSIGGPFLAVLGVSVAAAQWCLGTLPVSLLLGTIVGILDLQARRELTIIRASGFSVWRMLRAPLIGIAVFGLLIAIVGDTALVLITRTMALGLPQPSSSGGLWLEQRAGDETYIIHAAHPHAGGTVLEDVTFFLSSNMDGPRIEAPVAELEPGAWRIEKGRRFTPDKPAVPVADLRLETSTTPGDIGARLATPAELTIFELLAIESQRGTDARARAGIQMRLLRLLALPLTLAGSVLIAFAFTTGYRRTNKYGATVLYGIVLGFVVYVVTETAGIAGAAGMLQPAFAAFVPALVAIVVGTTILLFREDGAR